jgi:rieske iron-sulfur protein
MAEGNRIVPRKFGDCAATRPATPGKSRPSEPGPGTAPDRDRRGLIRAGLCGGLAALVGSAPARVEAAPDVLAGDLLVHGRGDKAGQPIAVDALEPLKAVMAHPKGADGEFRAGNRNLVVVLRVPDGELDPSAADLAAGNVVAFSAICTHQGCFVNRVGMLGASKGKLTCQCHGSTFEPRNAGKNLGGPAPRDLPALPVRAEDGLLVVAGSFTGPVGPS